MSSNARKVFEKDDVLIENGHAEIPFGFTEIGDGAFLSREDIISVQIPDSVTSIGDVAFLECRKLKTINIPYGVTSIGERAFRGCRNLNDVHIPNSVISIGLWAFAYCTWLSNIELPKSVPARGFGMFKGCNRPLSYKYDVKEDFRYSHGWDDKGYYVENTGNIPIEINYIDYISTFPAYDSISLEPGEKTWPSRGSDWDSIESVYRD